MPLEVGYREELEVGFAGQRASQAPDGVFHAAFLPRTMGIAEEGLDAEGSVKPVMLSELVSVVEADGFAHCLGKFAELTADGPSGADRFSIEWLVNHVEAGLPFVENKQPLATSGECETMTMPTLPVMLCPAAGVAIEAIEAGRSVIERRCLMRLAGLRPGRCPRLRLRRGSRRCQQSF